MNRIRTVAILAGLVALFLPAAHTQIATPAWGLHGRNPQHTGIAAVGLQHLNRVKWRAPVDLNPQYGGNGALYAHYGSPVITQGNSVVLSVKTGASDGFRIDVYNGNYTGSDPNGERRYTLSTGYTQPPHGWGMPVGVALTPKGRLLYPDAGGAVSWRDSVDSATGASGKYIFYGLNNYVADPGTFDSKVKICTPITVDRYGSAYFGIWAAGDAPLGLKSGVVKINYDGTFTQISSVNVSGDAGQDGMAYNCAPALSNDQRTLYVVTRNTGDSSGYLVAMNPVTMARTARVALYDVKNTENRAIVYPDGTSSPTIGPDGDVYFGVLENGFGSNGYRGWLLHFDATLTTQKPSAAFGWDYSAAIVPRTCVPSYTGTSKYLILAKYNQYVQGGNDGNNRVALLDPNATAVEPISGLTLMREVLTKPGATPDTDFIASHPNAVREWCLNTIAVDVVNNVALVNNEDGKAYRWDFATNTLQEPITLTGGIGQAYTPTVIGPDGTGYAMSNATIYAIGE